MSSSGEVDESSSGERQPSWSSEAGSDYSSRSHPSSSPRKRKRTTEDTGISHKRKHKPFSAEYIILLNDQIESAAERGDQLSLSRDTTVDQIGCVQWTREEKAILFNTLGRLGQRNLLGIAAQIPTKSPLEVSAFIQHVQASLASRPRSYRDTAPRLRIPAAAEISPECCLVLEGLADAVSLFQERQEEELDEAKWDPFPPVITQHIAEELKRDDTPLAPNFTRLFDLTKWLQLSDRIFMNAAWPVDSANNWRSVSEDPPSMRSTALEDFYGMAVRVTKRLVIESLRIAESRISSKGLVDSKLQRLVREDDVTAAIQLLDVPSNRRQFWATSARRLRLDVVDDDDAGFKYASDSEEEGPRATLTYPRVEELLDAEAPHVENRPSESIFNSSSEISSDVDAADDEISSVSDSVEESDEAVEDLEEHIQKELDDEAIKDDMRELLFHSVIELRQTKKVVAAVKRRVVAEHSVENHLEAMDVAQSAREELRLWKALRNKAPDGLAEKTEAPRPLNMDRVSLNDVYPQSDWSNMAFVDSWERPIPD